jgi:hypothetical protein
MKLVFLVLVLVNVLLFGLQQGIFGRVAERGREPERVARQIEPERIRVLSEADVQELRERVSKGDGPVDLAVAHACLEFGDFAAVDAARAETALAALPAPTRATSRPVQASGWYMVYLPAHKTRLDADRRADELRRLGVKDLLVMGENSPLKFAISLGSFRDEETARAHLVEMERIGVKGVRMSDRPSSITMTRFQLRDLDTAAARQLASLVAGFPAQTVRPCQ